MILLSYEVVSFLLIAVLNPYGARISRKLQSLVLRFHEQLGFVSEFESLGWGQVSSLWTWQYLDPQHYPWNVHMFFTLSFFFTVFPKAVGLALCTVKEQADGCPEVLALCFLHKSKLRMNIYKEPWDTWHKKWYCKQKRFLWCCYFFYFIICQSSLVLMCWVTGTNTFSFTNKATGS